MRKASVGKKEIESKRPILDPAGKPIAPDCSPVPAARGVEVEFPYHPFIVASGEIDEG